MVIYLPIVRIICVLCSIYFGFFDLVALDSDKPVTQYKVRAWNTETGLPSNSIYTIFQTRDGYLWIGTQNGLVRFDGIHFQTFKPVSAPHLGFDAIYALYEEPDGTFWVGSNSGGLTRYKEGEFYTYPAAKYPALDKIRAINRDRWGHLWIGSFSGGLTSFKDSRFVTSTTREGLPHNKVRAMHSDANKDLWVVTAAGVFKLLNPGGTLTPGGIERYTPQPSLFYLTCLYREAEAQLWVGTWGSGLFRLEAGQVVTYGKQDGLPSLNITTLFQDRLNNLWIGSEGGGLVRMSHGKISVLSSRNGLADNSISALSEDNEGSLWVGTLDGGLHQLKDSKFTTYTSPEGPDHNYIGCVYQNRDGSLLVGTKKGLKQLTDGKLVTTITTRNGLLDNMVLCLCEDISGGLLIGTYGGLHRLKDGKQSALTKKDGLTGNRIRCLDYDRDGHLWIGTESGLNRRNETTGSISRFTTREGLFHNHIEFVHQDREGIIWIGTENGLNTIRGETVFVAESGVLMEKGVFRCVYEDNEGVLWFGTGDGLIRLNGDKITCYSSENGLSENDIYSILEDDAGYLWLAGRSGVSRIAKQELVDYSAGKIIRLKPEVYDERDGMKSRWCIRPGIKTRDGKMWFPTSRGISSVNPQKVKKAIPPGLVIERLVVDGEPVNLHSAVQKGTLLELPPGKKRIEFHYTGISFNNPHRIRFKIKLDGYDSHWVDMNDLRSTVYTSLKPGSYTFRVAAPGPGGNVKTNEVSLSFYLNPFFYQTTWFYLLAVLFVILAMVSIFRFKIRQLMGREKELKTQVDLRTIDLKERNIQLEKARQKIQQTSEKLKEMDIAKSRFFANISHEFRTPLTLIQGPLEQILSENPGKKMENRARMMLRNSRRLLNLVEQLLELAKFDSGKMKLRASYQNIVSFARSIVMCFESLAGQNNVELTFMAEADEIDLYFDPEKLERIFTNLLSNAFNYTPSGGAVIFAIRILVGTSYPSGCAEITVRDSGTGIPSGQLPHIFDRFYRGNGNHEYKRKGAGIGLALTKELVELHLGEIDVRSKEGVGTEFTLRLPMGSNHLLPLDIAESPSYDPEQAPRFEMRKYDDLVETPYDEEEPGGQTDDKPIILVIDDNADVRSFIRGALEPHFGVYEANNGREGIDKAREIMPNLVISDIMMPEVDGLELCAHLKSDIKTSHIPVILLTARASKTSISEGLETGADDYITKPFNTDLLVVRVRNLIRIRRQLQRKIRQDAMLKPDDVYVSSLDTKFIEELQGIIERNLDDPEFGVEQLSEKLFMSQSTLYRKVEALCGEPPKRFIRSYRLQRAAQLLKDKFGNVTEVAFAVGFSSAAYFAKCFKKKYHRPPSEFV